MLFPAVERAIYGKMPSEEVICQLRFPTLLRIESEKPAQFQEQIRTHYPLLKEKKTDQLPIPEEIRKMMGLEFHVGTGKRVFEFLSEDELWTVSLSSDALSLTSRAYERWEGFKDHLRLPLETLIGLYAPSFFTRIGLRYRDVIRRSALGEQATTPWSELLRPHIAAELSASDIASSVAHATHEVTFDLPDKGRLRVMHGLAQVSDEVSYVIDADFFTQERKVTKDAWESLDRFNTEARHFFRWCITERTHLALEPKPV